MQTKILFSSILVFFVVLLAAVSSVMVWHSDVVAAEAVATNVTLDPSIIRWGYLAAAIATSISSLAAAYAVASVGAAAVGALTEKPELLGRLLILVGLAEGIAIYGIIISVLIMNRLG